MTHLRLAAAIMLMLLSVAGCDERLNTVYGRRGLIGTTSVNGTSALGEMFEQRGHTVVNLSRLTPRLMEQGEVIVWFPDAFKVPNAEVTQWLEDWLCNDDNRVLIYVGRDFDAGPLYWKKIRPRLNSTQQQEADLRLSDLEFTYNARRQVPDKNQEWQWAEWRRLDQLTPVNRLRGEPAWTRNIDVSKLEMEVGTRLAPAGADVLLGSNVGALVTEQEWCGSRVIVVANGSFLLNMQLVNHEHRKLAARLVDSVGSQRDVVFLESGPDEVPIRSTDEASRTGLEILGVPPFSTILLHMAAVGIILAFSRVAIFGLPRELVLSAPSDFGKHIDAMGRLLAKIGQRSYAMARLLQYQQQSHASRRWGGQAVTPETSAAQPNPPAGASAPPTNEPSDADRQRGRP